MRIIIALSLLLVLMASALALTQVNKFTQVDGNDLTGRLAAAFKQAQGQPFWIAYPFDVIRGVAIDKEIANPNGTKNLVFGMVSSTDARFETTNLGVFMRYEPAGNGPVKVELYNLERNRDFGAERVYWLANAGAEESIAFLKSLVESANSSSVYEQATAAIGLHDHHSVGPTLESLIRASRVEKVKITALFWLSKIAGEAAFLFGVVSR